MRLVTCIPSMSTTPPGSSTIPSTTLAPISSQSLAPSPAATATPSPTLAPGLKLGADIELNWGPDETFFSGLFGSEQVEGQAAFQSSGGEGSAWVPETPGCSENVQSMATSYFNTPPPSSQPVSPPHPDLSTSNIHTITSGVGPRCLGHTSTSSPECTDSLHPPVMEEIGGVPLIPGELDRFKHSSHGHASGKRKTR